MDECTYLVEILASALPIDRRSFVILCFRRGVCCRLASTRPLEIPPMNNERTYYDCIFHHQELRWVNLSFFCDLLHPQPIEAKILSRKTNPTFKIVVIDYQFKMTFVPAWPSSPFARIIVLLFPNCLAIKPQPGIW